MARTTKWFTTIKNPTTIGGGGKDNVNLLATFDAANAKGSTVTRMLIKLGMWPETLTTIAKLPWGITYVNADAVTANAFPDPEVGADNVDWLVRGYLFNGSSNISETRQGDRDVMDIGTMRICRAQQDQLHILLDNDSTINITYTFIIRVLLRLP